MSVEEFVDEPFQSADLAAGGTVLVDEVLEPFEPVPASWVVQVSGSMCSRRRSRASILPAVLSWSRTSVGSLAIWYPTW